MLAGLDEQVAKDNGMSFRQITLEECASTPSFIRDYIVPMYVVPNDGEIDIPIYLIISPENEIQGSGVIQTIQELKNLITSHQQWVSSKNA
jgi:hypothetical protein